MSTMVIVCEGCGARFRMNSALFQDARGARIRCRKCGGHIDVRQPEASPVPPVPEIPFPLAPSSDAPVSPEKTEPEKEAPLPEKAVFSPSVPVADTAPFSSGDNSYSAGPQLAGVPVGEPAGETSYMLEESPTFQADISRAVRPGTVSSPPEEQAIPPVSASIEAETEIEPIAEVESEPESVAEAAPEQDFSREEHAAEIASLKQRLRASRRRGPSMLTIFLFVVPGILLLAGGAFFFRDTRPAQELLRTFFPPSGPGDTARTVTTASAVGKPAYDVRDMNSFYVKTFLGGNLFVIQGTVANVGKGPSRGIRVQATLLGKDNQALVDNTVFAANLVDNTTLRHANRAVIEGLLGLRYGDRNVNRDIPAGASLPFMVVFFDPPGQIGTFTVKALDAE